MTKKLTKNKIKKVKAWGIVKRSKLGKIFDKRKDALEYLEYYSTIASYIVPVEITYKTNL